MKHSFVSISARLFALMTAVFLFANPAMAQQFNADYPYSYPGDYADTNRIKQYYNVEQVTDIDFNGKPALTEYYEDKPASYSNYPVENGGPIDPYRFLRRHWNDRRRPADQVGPYLQRRTVILPSYMKHFRTIGSDGTWQDTKVWLPYSDSRIQSGAHARAQRTFSNFQRRLGGTSANTNKQVQW